jgi:arylformamidase
LGDCFLVRHEGEVTADHAREMLAKASLAGAWERLLIGGKATVTLEAARVFAEAGIRLIGNESQTVGPEDAPMAVHLILLGAGVILLEGVVLAHVPEGKYFLSAAPLKLGGREGAPCRAMLIG